MTKKQKPLDAVSAKDQFDYRSVTTEGFEPVAGTDLTAAESAEQTATVRVLMLLQAAEEQTATARVRVPVLQRAAEVHTVTVRVPERQKLAGSYKRWPVLVFEVAYRDSAEPEPEVELAVCKGLFSIGPVFGRANKMPCCLQ